MAASSPLSSRQTVAALLTLTAVTGPVSAGGAHQVAQRRAGAGDVGTSGD